MAAVNNSNEQEVKAKPLTLHDLFKEYCSMDPISNAKKIQCLPLSQIDKWLIHAEILDNLNVTSTDTGICFFKFRKRAINYEEFLDFIIDLANYKKLQVDYVKHKLQNCASPLGEANQN